MNKYQPGQAVTINDNAEGEPLAHQTGTIGNAYNTIRRLVPGGEAWYSVKVAGMEIMRPESSIDYAQ